MWNQESLYIQDDTLQYIYKNIKNKYTKFSMYDINIIDKETWYKIISDITSNIYKLNNNINTLSFNQSIDPVNLINFYKELINWLRLQLPKSNYISIIGV